MTDEMRDRVVRVLVEEGLKDAQRDVRWYRRREAAARRDGLSPELWHDLLLEARAIRHFTATILRVADDAVPDPMDLAKETADIAAMAPGEVTEMYGR